MQYYVFTFALIGSGLENITKSQHGIYCENKAKIALLSNILIHRYHLTSMILNDTFYLLHWQCATFTKRHAFSHFHKPQTAIYKNQIHSNRRVKVNN